MLDHLAIQCADVPTAAAFYDTVLAPLGGSRQMDFGEVIGFGTPERPSFWVGPLVDRGQPSESTSPSSPPTGLRCAPSSTPPVTAGAEVLHEPRVWPEYHPAYYGAFVRDPDGNNVEAVCHTPE